jgi:predicted nucleic acid-binding protein
VIEAQAHLRAQCLGRGHALGQKLHVGDAWVAATAIAYDLPLAAIDGIYNEAPGLRLLSPPE